MNNLDLIQKNIIFKGFSINELKETFLSISYYEKNYKKNDIIVKHNELLKYFGIITEGKIATSNFDYFGNRNILTVFEKGQSFGEAIVCMKINFPHEIISMKESSILWIDYESLKNSNNCKKILNNLLILISRKNLILNQKLNVLSKRTTREKILSYLTNQKNLFKTTENIEINLNRNEMADYLSLDRSNLSRELGKLKKEGIIDFSKNKFKLL